MLRSPTVLVAIAMLLAYWPIAWFMDSQSTFSALNSFGITFGIAIIMAYAPGLKRSWKAGETLDPGHVLIVGINLAYLGMEGRTMWLWVWRLSGEPAGWLDHDIFGFMGWVIVTGAMLFLISPQVISGNVPKEGWRRLRSAVGAGFLLWGTAEAILWGYSPWIVVPSALLMAVIFWLPDIIKRARRPIEERDDDLSR